MSAHGFRVYPLRVSTRFRLTEIPGAPPLIEKRGDAAAIGREVAALTALEGRPWAPALVAAGPGWMRTTRLPGSPRAIAGAAPAEARRLGAVLRQAHEARRSGSGGLWGWEGPASSLAEYRSRRAGDTGRALAGTPDAGLAPAALAAGADAPDAPEPFRLLHGDLVEANVVWGPHGPGLVDWEFWRLGDPAEDLAYLIELNGLPDDVAAAVLEGYGLPGMGERASGWRALVAADAGAWYLAEGMLPEAARMLDRARSLV